MQTPLRWLGRCWWHPALGVWTSSASPLNLLLYSAEACKGGSISGRMDAVFLSFSDLQQFLPVNDVLCSAWTPNP